MKKIFFLGAFLLSALSYGQGLQNIDFNKEYKNLSFGEADSLSFPLKLKKGGVYEFTVRQKGIDVVLRLTDDRQQPLAEMDSPNGKWGPEQFEFVAPKTGTHHFTIKRFGKGQEAENERVNLRVRSFTKAEVARREKIKQDLAPENAKRVQTADIDHFWEAYDQLKNCKTHADSVATFQTLYLDRATDGLLDFMKVRELTAEGYVEAVATYPKFYNSIRANTYEAKKAEPLIEEVFQNFQALYPKFKPFKVCFAIGMVNTGGTVSNNFVLIGTEITTSTKEVDLSEFSGSKFYDFLAGEEDIVQKIKNMVAHESVHTQQKAPRSQQAIGCNLLLSVMHEGFCDFIGEKVAGGQINKTAQEWGDQHEAELWKEFKSEMCSDNYGNWLYNGLSVKDKPADLGYYIGYKIAKEYYQHAADKQQAIIDIIEMNNPLQFLEASKYDLKHSSRR